MGAPTVASGNLAGPEGTSGPIIQVHSFSGMLVASSAAYAYMRSCCKWGRRGHQALALLRELPQHTFV